MISIALTVLFYALLLSGIGWLVFPRSQSLPIPRFWIGWALALAALQIWHLFAPVTWLTLLPLLAAALIGGWRARPQLLVWLHEQPRWRLLVFAGLAMGLLLILSNQVMWSEFTEDHGMYHLPTVRWIEQYAIVPGLGNLHHRLAFNNSSFLLAALINTGPLPGLAFHASGPLLIWLLTLSGLSALLDWLSGKHNLQPAAIFSTLMLPVILFAVSTSSFAGYSPDLAIFAIGIVLAEALLRLFDRQLNQTPKTEGQLTAIMLLCAAGISVKLSFIVFAAGAFLAALLAVGWRAGWRRWPAWLGSGVLLVVPWLARGVILSGYPIFPSTLLPMPVAWRMPAAIVEPLAGIITSWARYRSMDVPVGTPFERFLFWQGPILFEIKEALLLFIAALFLVLIAYLFLHRKAQNWRGPAAVISISLLALIYWLVMAPDPRFAGAIFWLLPAAAVLLLIDQFQPALHGDTLSRMVIGLVILAFFWLSPNFTNNFSFSRLLTPPTDWILAREHHAHEAIINQWTNSGLMVYTADYRSGESCWDAPLPCTRINDFDPRLELLRPGDLQSGFRLRIDQ